MNKLRDEFVHLQDKLTFFLLSLSSASIAFSLTQADQTSMSYFNFIQLLPVIAWGVSILAGYKYILGGEGIIIANHTYLEFKKEEPENESVFKAWLDGRLKELCQPRERWKTAQVWLFLAGAVIFIFNEVILRAAVAHNTSATQILTVSQ